MPWLFSHFRTAASLTPQVLAIAILLRRLVNPGSAHGFNHHWVDCKRVQWRWRPETRTRDRYLIENGSRELLDDEHMNIAYAMHQIVRGDSPFMAYSAAL
jgi:hypothetical protein